MFYTHVDQSNGQIFMRYVKDGERRSKYFNYVPTLYTPSNDPDSPITTITGECVEPFHIDSLAEMKQLADSNIPGSEVYGCDVQAKYHFLNDLFKDKEIKFDKSLISISSLDIETEAENGFPDVNNPEERINVITVYDSIRNHYTTWALHDIDKNMETDEVKEVLKNSTLEIRCFSSNETEMLKDFMNEWKVNHPDIITGWNSSLFDMPYLYARIVRLFGEFMGNQFSPIHSAKLKNVFVQGQSQTKLQCDGLSHLDYLDLYKKFTMAAKESYKLDYIAWVELGKRKTENPYESFKEFYANDFKLFVEYNIQDVALLDAFEKKLGLITLIMTIAYIARVNYEDVFSPVKTWDMLIFKYLYQNNMVPPLASHREKVDYAGAYVMQPTPGFYDWIASFDLTSLYPSIIMSYNMSPETLYTQTPPEAQGIEYKHLKNGEASLEGNGYTMAANGAIFDTSQPGILPTLVAEGFNMRKEAKNNMKAAKQKYQDTGDEAAKEEADLQDVFQYAFKILLNSLYGAAGNVHFRYFNLKIAEGITLTGQEIIKYARDNMNEYLQNKGLNDKVFYCDTDSLYLSLANTVQKMGWDKLEDQQVIDKIDALCTKKLEPLLEEWYQNLARRVGNPENKIHMEREIIAKRGLWVSKKRYIGLVYDNEGLRYDEPELKVMGIEAVRSSTPEYCREKIKKGVEIALKENQEALMTFINQIHAEFETLPVERIAYPRGVSDLEKYMDPQRVYAKGTPMANRGALMYNKMLEEKGLDTKYEKIRSSDKIKFVHLKMPNPLREDVIAFPSVLPAEFGLHEYVDYNRQFVGAFKQPLENIVKHVGWKLDGQISIEDFFG